MGHRSIKDVEEHKIVLDIRKIHEQQKQTVAQKAYNKVYNELNKIVPTPAPTDVLIRETKSVSLDNIIINKLQTISKDISHSYCCVNTDIVSKVVTLNSAAAFKLIFYIIKVIDFESNYVEIDPLNEDLQSIPKQSLYDGINALCDARLIYKTTKQKIYVVDHRYIFKGKLETFAKLYAERVKAGMVCSFDAKGRIII